MPAGESENTPGPRDGDKNIHAENGGNSSQCLMVTIIQDINYGLIYFDKYKGYKIRVMNFL